jgi:hypothetical protein
MVCRTLALASASASASASALRYSVWICMQIAFHPSGLHVIVGFADKLRLLNLLVDNMRVYKDFPIKACREVQFSNGGQFFAATNVNMVMVYNFYSGECLQTLRAHSQKVRSLYWTLDDSGLISAGYVL